MNFSKSALPARSLVGLLLLVGLALTGPVNAAPADAETESSASSRLADILEDEAARAELIRELRRQADSPATDAEQSATSDEQPISLSRRIARGSQAFAQGIVGEFSDAASSMSALDFSGIRTNLASFGDMAFDLGVVIIATVLGFIALRRLIQPGFAAANRWAEGGLGGAGLLRRVLAVMLAFIIDLLAILSAWVGGYLLALFGLSEAGVMDARQTMFLNAFLVIELFKLSIRTLFASRFAGLRLIPMAAEDAAYWNLWLARMSSFIGYGMLLVVPIINFNLSPALGRLMAMLIMGLAFVNALIIVLQNRQSVRDKLDAYARNLSLDAARILVAIIARIWHWLALAYFGALALLSLTQPETAMPYMGRATVQTLLAIGGGVFVSLLLTQVIVRQIRVPAETSRRFPMLEARLNSFIPSALKAMRLGILVLVLALVLDAWRLIDLRAWLASDPGLYALGSLTSVAVILAGAMVLWIGIASWIEHRLNPETGSGEPTARQRTLLALFRNALAITLIIMTAMIVLSEVGIDIGPLIAGAGVLGLAIGFGAQKLVQDIITGVFIQLENAINTGDVVSVAGVTGTAEKITIRSLGIRDLSGTYHIVPFSSVDSVSNYMRDFAYHVGEYGVAYRENTDEVIALLRDAFNELAGHADHGPKIIGELEVHGVTALADSAVNLRVRIKTLPGSQWAIGREYNRLVKQHLDAAGVEIPFPHMTVYFGEDKQGQAPPAHLQLSGAAGLLASPAAPAQSTDPARHRANPVDKGDFDDQD